ncbi:MAG TPA: hypothetical protein VFS32_05190 [Candidatus Limnocylindrales bacterium]|nr:hypothetical protein [Candidatus Limnocylindrales bacterium]
MVRLFDGTFLAGTALVVVALAVAAAAVARADIPIVGNGAGALLLVAVVGMAACMVGGISQAPTVGWTAPSIMAGTALGLLAIAIVAAGLLGWAAVFQPIAGLLPSAEPAVMSIRAATVVLAALIAVKWLVAVAMAVLAPAPA